MHRTPRHRSFVLGPLAPRYRLLILGLLAILGLWGHAPTVVGADQPARAADQPARVLDLKWDVAGEVTSISMRLSAPVRYRTAESARSIAVDLWTANIDADREVPVDRGVASAFAVRRMTPGVVRLAISLRQPSHFKVYVTEDRMTVKVFPEWQSAVPLPQSVGYRTMSVPTGPRRGRARVHVVTIDPRAPGLVIRPEFGGGVISATGTTSTAAARLEAVAAINGSFYSGYSGLGLPLGLIVIDGRVLSAPLPRRPIFAVDDKGRPWIGSAQFTGRLVTEGGAEVPISAINRPPRWGGVALYTPEYGPFTAPQAYIVIVREDRVVGFSSGRPAIPSDGYALATAASQRFLLDGLTRGQPVRLQLALTPPGIHHAIQGGPHLVRNGQTFIPYGWEGFGDGFYHVRTARSAIGITAGGKVLFVTVDRRSRGSSGMNLPELAALMQGLGARDAMNLDGGGSATLVVGGRVVNALPRGGERTVSSMLVTLRRPVDKVP